MYSINKNDEIIKMIETYLKENPTNKNPHFTIFFKSEKIMNEFQNKLNYRNKLNGKRIDLTSIYACCSSKQSKARGFSAKPLQETWKEEIISGNFKQGLCIKCEEKKFLSKDLLCFNCYDKKYFN